MNGTDPGQKVDHPHPFGYRARRGLNWGPVGLMYAAFYMMRYNYRLATPAMKDEFGFDKAQFGDIFTAWFWSYGVGQLVNGLLTDRIGGKRAMLIGCAGTITMNVLFGFASYGGAFPIFMLLWGMSGYLQAFGAPGMIKMNAAWFARSERGRFAGIFGFMIQLGLWTINWLGPALLAGLTILVWTLPGLHWRWLFWVPPMFGALVAVMLLTVVKETPEAAGFRDAHGGDPEHAVADTRTSIKETFFTIAKHPLVWFYAAAYFCTGAVRHGADSWLPLYFKEVHNLPLNAGAAQATLQLMPLAAVLGSLASGYISDTIFKGRRSPVAATLYFVETCVILVAAHMVGLFWNCLFLILIALTANSTHSIVGAAAPMDIGGRKNAGFAAGVIDSFQYFGAGVAGAFLGRLLKQFGWDVWFYCLAGFGALGGCMMLIVMRKQKRLARQAQAAATSSP
jgi:OPA family glycerol-3-phosphate transporter-like MFS transporter